MIQRTYAKTEFTIFPYTSNKVPRYYLQFRIKQYACFLGGFFWVGGGRQVIVLIDEKFPHISFLFCFVIPVSINIVQFSTAIVDLSQVDRETPLVNFALLLGLLFYLLFWSMSTRKKSRKYTNKHGASKCLFCPSHILLYLRIS